MPVLAPYRRRSLLTPWREFDGFDNRIRRFFDEAIGEAEQLGWSPAVEVAETDDAMELTAELPGVKPEDVQMEIEGNVLTLHGTKKAEHEEEKKKDELRYRVWERSYGEFSRAFTLPSTVDVDKIEAEFKNGVLNVRMPKMAEAKGRRIAIEAK